ncbi:hypothetical protein QTP88_009960 [Uroleucon formosanum]
MQYISTQPTSFSEKDLENIIRQLPKPFIITGDFNSQNVRWGSLNTDNRGKEIEKILESDNLVLLNSMESTRINSINGNLSNIDLSFANASIAIRLDWSVSNHITSSDHFPIVIKIVFRHIDSTPKLERCNLKNPNLQLFSELLEYKVTNINVSEFHNTEELVEEFTETIIAVANLTIEKTKSKTPKPKVPWWNQDIKKGYWPKKWKSGIIIPILKPEKNQFKTDGYRPITLLNTMCKLFEKIINYRLSWYPEKIAFLSPKQNGFRKNRSTMDSFYEINEEIKQTLENKQLMGVINLDIPKAYDITWRHYIIVKLNSIIKILSHASWGADSMSLIKIFNAIIQSKINYGSILYRTAAKSTLKLIDTVNNSGLRLAIGAFRSSPILSIYNIAGIPPSTLRRIELSKTSQDWPGKTETNTVA